GLVFLIAAFMMLYTHSASWDIGGFGQWLRHNPGNERNLIFVLLVISFGLKSAFFPFHSWLPRAHAAAPAHVSALMSGVIHKAGLYALVRFALLIGKPDEWMAWFLIGFSALSAVIGAIYTVGQRDLKRLLGYSSTENVGIAGIGLGVGCLGLSWGNPVLITLGFAGGLLHILNHAFFKCQLFYAAGAVYQSTHTVNMERLGGLSRLMPWTAFSFILGGLAISALPPLNGFTGEFVIYAGLFNVQAMGTEARVALYATGGLLAFVGAVSALSMTRAYGVVFLGAPRDPTVKNVAEVNRWMLVPMGMHGIGVILLGVMPVLGLTLVEAPVRLALSSASQEVEALKALANGLTRVGAISALLVLVTAGLIWLRFKASAAPTARNPTWGCGYQGASARMQYTGSGFSAEFGARFSAVMLTRRRRKAPLGYFPTDSYLITDCVDAVERRLFSVISRGDASAAELSGRLHEDDPRIAFGAALIAIILIVALVLLSGGQLR
ncbi:MAG: proton-conducting transporter membrane subunit, partial [Burkholderiaceae bacterium]|nr:proton-conducting transporter membrane subunit [Burkholderiaceae bacterium]